MEDSLYRFKDLYHNSPTWLKRMAGQAYGTLPLSWRYGSQYRHFRELLKVSDRWDRAALDAYQLAKITELLERAYARVPFYRQRFDAIGLEPGDIKSFTDMARIPLLTKEDLREHLEELTASDLPASARLYLTTGGSTGIPVGFYLQKGTSRARELAFIQDQWSRVGYRDGDRCVFIRGTVLNNLPDGVFWEYEPIKNHLVMSSYHLTDDRLPGYIEALKSFAPRYIQAYPSAISLVAAYMQAHDIAPPPGLQAILCGSENLYPAQRVLLEKVFRCRVYSWYGHAERAVLGGECEHSTDYHLYPQYGFAEVTDAQGRPVEGDGAVGEIIATSFDNDVMPLIRYRTMDVGVWAEGPCPCGRAYPRLKRVDGRLQELVVTATGRRISMTAINMHSDVFDNVRQFQFVQHEAGVVTYTYVPKPTFGEADEVKIRHELGEKFGQDMVLDLLPVVEIPLTQSGKYRFLVQSIPDVHEFAGE